MSEQTLNINGRNVKLNTGLFIGGEFVKPKADKTFPVEDPRTGKTIIEVSEGSADDVDIAVKIARKTMNDPAWNELNPAARGQFLLKLAGPPFRGYRESGLGRECGEAALENYTETKAVFFNMGVDAPQ